MTRSNKIPKNPAKSTIKSLKSVTTQKATWRKWHNQPALLARQATDERRHDRLLGRFDIIHHVTTTRSRFCVTFLFQLPLLPNCYLNPFRQPILNLSPSTCSVNLFRQPVTTNLLSHPLLHPFHLAVHPLNRCINHISAGDRYCLLCLLFCLLSLRYQSI